MEYFVHGSKNKMVTILRFQVISEKFTAYRMCIHSVIHPHNTGRKQEQQQQQQTTTTIKYNNIKNFESYRTQSYGHRGLTQKSTCQILILTAFYSLSMN